MNNRLVSRCSYISTLSCHFQPSKKPMALTSLVGHGFRDIVCILLTLEVNSIRAMVIQVGSLWSN